MTLLKNKNYTLKLLMLMAMVAVSFSFESCRKKKPKNYADKPTPTGSCKLDYKAPHPLITYMRNGEFQYDWFSGKMDCEASDDSTKVNFSVILRMKKDSAIWMLIKDPVVGIPVARVLITCDSVKFVQYQDGTLSPQPKCFEGDFVFLSQLLQTDVDLDMMQSLLVGNSVSFFEDDEKLKSSINEEQCNYTLGTIRKRKVEKVLAGQKPLQDLQTISLEPLTFKILKILFIDAQNRNFTATYSDFQKEDSMSFPHHEIFFAKGLQKSARLEVDFKKINLTGPLEFPFSFPEDCQPFQINK